MKEKGTGLTGLFTTALAYCALVLQVQATTHYVDLAGSHAAPFTGWATAATNIQAAVDAAANGDTVLVTNGMYLLTAEIVVTNNITLRSVNGPDVTIVDGGGSSDPLWNRCFNLGSSACVISGFTIANGLKNNQGGGIYCVNFTPVVTNCTISGNQAAPISGAPGGGMYYGTANNCTFIGNTAYQGGGKMSGIANNCTFIGNTARKSGGGMLAGTANNCTIIGNTAEGVAGGGGGGIFGSTVNNCIVWYNFAPINSDIYLGTQNYTCSPGVTNGAAGNITNAPAFVDKDNGDFRLASSSPCINAGANVYVVGTTDLDGASRIVDTIVDMGAYEFVVLDHYVALSGSHVDPFSSWATAATNIQAAVAVADDGHAVHVTNGTYFLTTEIVVTNNITLESVNGPDVTIVDGGNATRCFNLGSSACVISGLMITNGRASGDGGGILCSSTIPVATNCTIVMNQAFHGNGGGMYFGTANNCTISGNTASQGNGGGMYFGAANNCMIIGNTAHNSGGGAGGQGGGMHSGTANNCSISDNTANPGGGSGGEGGGMHSSTANNCTISGNTANYGGGSGGAGGGMYDGTANDCTIIGNTANGTGGGGGGMLFGTASNCTISGNTASSGGGMRNGTANNCTIRSNTASTGGGIRGSTANNCTISDNTATGVGGGGGGALWGGGGMRDGTANNCLISSNTAYAGGGMRFGTANNCTISGNMATAGDGGGMRNGTANNCIVWYNPAVTNNNIYSAVTSHTCSSDVTDGVAGNITNAPAFVDKDNGNYRLAFDSPCRNAGTNGYVVGTTDLDGASRIVDTTVDMGAYEYDALTADSDGDGMTDGWEDLYFGSATGAVASANADVDPSNNGDEFIAGTDPTNAASFFAITTVAPMGAGFELQWDAVIGRLYSVNWTDSLTSSFQTLEIDIAYPQNTYTDTVHAAEAQGFYEMEVKLAE